jgi:hypothetical protein
MARFTSLTGSRISIGLALIFAYWLQAASVEAQTRTLPSHGKIQLDSSNLLLRDVHPASQAQTNYLENRLLGVGVRKAEREEQNERIDVYQERRRIEKLQGYDRDLSRLSTGSPTTAYGLATLWMLVGTYGDYTEVHEALLNSVPALQHDQFVPANQFILFVQPNGELEPPPLVLQSAGGRDVTRIQTAWTALVKEMRAADRLSAPSVTEFQASIASYRKDVAPIVEKLPPASGRRLADRYVRSLESLASALQRPTQAAEIRQYVRQNGYAYYGSNLLGLIQHLRNNRLTPVTGSTAQLALAEVARPLSRVLEQEIAYRVERIDSLAVGEGHRPYAGEFRPQARVGNATTGTAVSRAVAAKP